MAKTSLIGPGYLGRSIKDNSSRCINYFPELNSKDSSAEYSLVGTPGCHLWTTAPGVVRGSHVFNGVVYQVIGSSLYSVDNTGTYSSSLGTLTTSSGRVEMSDNGLMPTGHSQLCIVDGTNVYIWNVNTSAFTAGTLPLPNGANIWCPVICATPSSVTTPYFFTIAYNTNYGAYSADGLTWTKVTMSTTAKWKSVAFNGTVFCAISAERNGTIAATSPDFITWTARTLPAAGAASAWYSITAMGNLFCAVSYNSTLSITSTNGSSWSSGTLPSTSNWQYVCNNGTNGFLVVSSYQTAAAISSDGINWTAKTLPSASGWFSGVWSGNIWCVMGTGVSATSSNGTTWAQHTIGSSGQFMSVSWSGEIFYSIDATNGYGYSSPDGITWTKRNLPVSGAANWLGIVWSGEYFCAVNNTTGYSAISMYGINFDGSNFIKVDFSAYSIFTPYTITFLNGYFIISFGAGQYLPLDLHDGTQYSAENNSTADAFPDDLLVVYANHGELWLLGEYTTEVWDLTGAISPLFQRISGGVLAFGIAARYSLVTANNTVYWLATRKYGEIGEFYAVVAASGYTAVPVSTPAITYLISQISKNYGISDAWAYSFTMEGHEFIRFTFPSDNGGNGSTYQFDTSTNLWSEVMTYPYNYSNPGRHIGNTYFYFNNKHYLSSYVDGKIYEMSSAYYDDFENAITSTRIVPPLDDKTMLNNTFISKVQVDVDINLPSITTISTGSHPPYDLLYDGTWLWCTTTTNLLKINPSLNTVVGTFNIGVGLLGLDYGFGSVWVADNNSNPPYLYRINPATGAIQATITVGSSYGAAGVICAYGYVWVSNNGTGQILKIDPSTNGVVYTTSSEPGPYRWANDGTNLWLTTNSGFVEQFDPSTGNMINAISYPQLDYDASPSGIAFDGTYLWVSDYNFGDIYKINPTTYTTVSKISTGMNSLSGVTYSNGWVYVCNYAYPHNATGGNVVFKINTTTATIENNLNIGPNPNLAVSISDVLYVSNYDSNKTITTFLTDNYLITLSYSKDGGVTWSTPMPSIGNINVKNSRLIWYRLGTARQWQFNLTDTRMSKKVLLDAYIDVQGGTS